MVKLALPLFNLSTVGLDWMTHNVAITNMYSLVMHTLSQINYISTIHCKSSIAYR